MLSALAACVAGKIFSIFLQFLGILGKCYAQNSCLYLLDHKYEKKVSSPLNKGINYLLIFFCNFLHRTMIVLVIKLFLTHNREYWNASLSSSLNNFSPVWTLDFSN